MLNPFEYDEGERTKVTQATNAKRRRKPKLIGSASVKKYKKKAKTYNRKLV